MIRRLLLLWAALALYFGFRLAPDVWTPLYRHPAYAAYLWSLPLAVGALAWVALRGLAAAYGGTQPRGQALGRALGAAGGLAVFAATIALGAWTTRGLPLGSHAEAFRSERWREAGSRRSLRDLTPRQKMVGDLVRRVLPGRGRADIVALLGEAGDALQGGSDGQLVFHLGAKRGPLAPDDEWLVIELDEADRFAGARIHGN